VKKALITEGRPKIMRIRSPIKRKPPLHNGCFAKPEPGEAHARWWASGVLHKQIPRPTRPPGKERRLYCGAHSKLVVSLPPTSRSLHLQTGSLPLA